MKRFFLALRFLTVYPFGSDPDVSAEDLAASTLYYPLVGALLGIILFWFWQAAKGIWPVFLASALTVALWVFLTAGLHLDGLMDMFDGLGVRGNREKRLTVMKDSRVGAFGAQAAVLAVFLKIAAVAALSAEIRHVPVLILAPVAGRTAMVALLGTCRYARPEGGLGKDFTEGTHIRHVLLSVVLFLLLGLPAVGTGIVPVFLAQAVLFLLFRAFVQRNFGGITGDITGAACEWAELAILVTAPLFL